MALIKRVRNHTAVSLIQDKLVPGEEFSSVEEMKEQIADAATSDRLYFSVALDESGDQVLMFVIAYLREDRITQVIQIWRDPSKEEAPLIHDRMLHLFEAWMDVSESPKYTYRKTGVNVILPGLEKDVIFEVQNESV